MKNNKTTKSAAPARGRKTKSKKSAAAIVRANIRRSFRSQRHEASGLSYREMEDFLGVDIRWCAWFHPGANRTRRRVAAIANGYYDDHLAALRAQIENLRRRFEAAGQPYPEMHFGLCRVSLLNARTMEKHAAFRKWLDTQMGIGEETQDGKTPPTMSGREDTRPEA